METKTHAVAVYGTTRYLKKVQVSFKQRIWKRRRDGIKQRYHKTVTKKVSKFVKGGQRITVYGTAKDVRKAVDKIHKQQWIPNKKFVDRVAAKDFLDDPEEYAKQGEWIDFEENESP